MPAIIKAPRCFRNLLNYLGWGDEHFRYKYYAYGIFLQAEIATKRTIPRQILMSRCFDIVLEGEYVTFFIDGAL